MRKLLLSLAVLAVVAAQAFAVTLPSGYMAASVTDRSSLFQQTTTGGSWTATPTGTAPAVGQEQRTVFSVDAINYGTLAEDFFGQFVAGGGQDVGYQSNTLAGTVYDLVIGSVGTPSGFNRPDLFFVPGTRYTSTGGTDGTWTDMVGSPVTSAEGFGGILAIYEVPANTVDFTQGHGAWSEGTGAATTDGSMSATDEYPTISGSDPWLVAVFAPLLNTATVVYEGGTATGWKGTAFANIIGGTYAKNMILDAFGTDQDIRLDFTVTIPISGGQPTLADGWQTTSLDPVSFGVIPEPATISLIGLGLAGLGVIRRRK